MVLKVFAIYDGAINAWLMPHFLRSKGEATRMFMEGVNDPQTMLYKSPKDFTLFEIAEYDDQTGRFENLKAPIGIGTAIEFKRGEQLEISHGTSIQPSTESRDPAIPLRS